MVENSSGKEEKSKLTSLKIRSAKNFQPSGREFSILLRLFFNSLLQTDKRLFVSKLRIISFKRHQNSKEIISLIRSCNKKNNRYRQYLCINTHKHPATVYKELRFLRTFVQ